MSLPDSRNREAPFPHPGAATGLGQPSATVGSQPEPALLEGRDLACVRGDRRLFGTLNLRVGPGQVLRVLGANGAGKTSLLRQLAGLSCPAEGEVHWRGLPIVRQREGFAAELLFLGHPTALKDDLSALENLQSNVGLSGWPVGEVELRQALARWDMLPQARLPIRVLSAGQRRRVSLCRLELSPARLWILDEPFTALDTAAVDLLGQSIERHLARGGLAVLTSHQPLPVPRERVVSLQLTG